MANTVTPEELKQLQENQQKLNQLVANIGITEIGVEQLTEQLNQLKAEKSSIFKQLKDFQVETDKFNQSLSEKYGEGEVNINTGEVFSSSAS